MISKFGISAAAAGLAVLLGFVPHAQGGSAAADVKDASGNSVGTVSLTDTHAGVLITGDLSGLPPGPHGIHVHAVGKCEPPFTTAGGHFNPGMTHHGFKNAQGPHVGDLPNISMPASGPLHFEFLLAGATLHDANAILDADGAAIVIHATQDDYASDPAGNSGARIACGVVTAH
ncbi:MAG TPA: superoxide dismutase family protein [Gemmatimonadaceae bacterium]|jgi:Cu-Zn family superoxide dismutase|nr:superoxide dismutase family protein [Gemmatimonadaceae bacterium]